MNKELQSQSGTMSDNEKKLYEIECSVWKDNGEFATREEVIAARAAVKAMLPELSGDDHISAIDLLSNLTRYNRFREPEDKTPGGNQVKHADK